MPLNSRAFQPLDGRHLCPSGYNDPFTSSPWVGERLLCPLTHTPSSLGAGFELCQRRGLVGGKERAAIGLTRIVVVSWSSALSRTEDSVLLPALPVCAMTRRPVLGGGWPRWRLRC
jgi:hypothetical protein